MNKWLIAMVLVAAATAQRQVSDLVFSIFNLAPE